MTMPQGPAGLDLQQWLQDNQGNAAPPADPWITPWTSQNNLSDLHNRTEANIRQHYQESLPGLNVTPVDVDLTWWDGLVDAFTNVVGSLPEWLSGLRTVLEWVGTNFDATFRPVFEWFMGIINWLKANVADTLIQAIFNTLKTINNSVTLPIFEGIIQILAKFKPVLDWFSTTIGSTANTFWDGIISILEWIDTNLSVPIVQNLLSFFDAVSGAFSNTLMTVLTPALEFLGWVFENLLNNQFTNTVRDLLTRAYGFLEYLFQTLFPGAISGAIKDVADFLQWVSASFAGTIQTVLQPIFTALQWVWTNLTRGTTSLLNSLIAPAATFFDWVFNDLLAGSWSQVQNFLAPAFEFLKYLLGLFNLNGLQDVFSGLKSVVNQFGSFWSWIDQLAGVQWIKGIVQSITGVVSDSLSGALQALLGWAQNIPGMGMIISGILGNWKNPATGTNTTLPDLIAWSTRQLTIDTVVPSGNLVGYVPQELMALLPVGHVSDTQPNLVTDQAFASDAALQSGAGWSWSGETATGSSGGSAKVVGDGGIKQLFSNLIAVSPGQQLSISARTKWTKPMSAMPAIVIGVRGYEGEIVKFTTAGASVTGKANYANNSSGSSSYTVGQAGTIAEFKDGWVTITGSFTIPAVTAGYTISNCRMYIGVINAPTGTTVWFDDVVMKKTSLLPQDLVKELSNDLGAKLPTTDFNVLLNNVAKKTGATLDDVKAAVAGFLNGNSYLNGSNIQYGNISSEFINELKRTWSEVVYYGATNGSSAPGQTLGLAAEQLRDLANQVTQNSGLTTQLSSSLNSVASKLTSASAAIGQLQTDVTALQTKVNTTPTTQPPVTPTIVSVVDDFERVSLGANWGSPYIAIPGEGSSLGILNGHDAWFFPPSVTTQQNYATAIYAGTGSQSNSLYQRIYATIGTKGSVPLYGSPGYNDLVGRASSAAYCIICRFFANGVVKFYYRNGSTADGPATEFASFTSPVAITAGSIIEFQCGNKASGNPNMCYAKVGTSLIGPAYFPTIANLGKGWGFGMGNGISLAAPQPAGTLNYWAAEDQL